MDSLRKVLLISKEDTSKFNVLMEIGNNLQDNNPDTAIYFHKSAKALALELNNPFLICAATRQIGWDNYAKSNYAKALSIYSEALSIIESVSDNTQKQVIKYLSAKIFSGVGTVYKAQAEYPKALVNYFNALKISEELGNKQFQAITLGNIGAIYYDLSDYTRALEYYTKALEIAEKLNDKYTTVLQLGNISGVYFSQSDYPRALDYLFRTLKIAGEINHKQLQVNTLSNIGIIFNDQKDFSRAMEYYLKAIKLAREMGDKHGIAAVLGNIGSLYIETHEYEKAEKYLEESLAICDSIGALSSSMDYEQIYCDLDSARGNYKGALYHYKKYISLKDSITSEENTKKQTRTEMQYEFDKKDAEAKAEQDKKDAVTKIVIYSISGGLLLVLILAVFIFRSYRQKQKANVIITQQKREVEMQKHLVEMKQKEVLDSIHYAKRIQQALMTNENYIDNKLKTLRK